MDAPRHQRAADGPGVLAGARQHERADVGLLERVEEGAAGHDDRQHLAARAQVDDVSRRQHGRDQTDSGTGTLQHRVEQDFKHAGAFQNTAEGHARAQQQNRRHDAEQAAAGQQRIKLLDAGLGNVAGGHHLGEIVEGHAFVHSDGHGTEQARHHDRQDREALIRQDDHQDGRDECHKIQTEMPFKATEDCVEAFQRSCLFLREGETKHGIHDPRRDERRDRRPEHGQDMIEKRHFADGRSNVGRVGYRRHLVADVRAGNDGPHRHGRGIAERLPNAEQRHADGPHGPERSACGDGSHRAQHHGGQEEMFGRNQFQPPINDGGNGPRGEPRCDDHAYQRKDGDGDLDASERLKHPFLQFFPTVARLQPHKTGQRHGADERQHGRPHADNERAVQDHRNGQHQRQDRPS